MSWRGVSTFLVAVWCATGMALALPQSYVATSGKDAWPCDRGRPCRTLARALAVTDAGGTVVILDSGVFAESAVDIRQAVSIVAAPGTVAELTAPGGSTGVVFVNAGADDVVVLRGLTITGQPGTPLNGIVYNSAGALHVEGCVVSAAPTKGILALSHGLLFVSDAVFRGCLIGVSVEGARATLERVRAENNEFGVFVTLGAVVTARNTVAAGNSNAGFLASTLGTSTAELNLEDCSAANNGDGLRAEAFDNSMVRVRISGCAVANNAVGVRQTGGAVIESRGTSTVRGNGTDVVGTLTAVAGR